MAAYQRALDADEHCIDAINALERLYRRTQAWDRLVDVLAKKSQVVNDTEQAIRLKLQVGELWEDRLGDNDRAVDAYKEVLSVDPRNLPALTALDALYEKTGRMEEYLENLEHRLEVSPPEEDRVAHVPEDGDDLGGELRQARSRHRGAGEDPAHRRAQREGVPRPRAALPPGAQVGVAGRHLPQAPRRSRPTPTERIDLYTKMGQVYEQELRDLDRAIESYNDVLSRRGRSRRRAGGPRRACTRRPSSGIAPST